MQARPTRHLVGMAILLLLGHALRVAGLERQSLWFDEAFSVQTAGLPIVDLLRANLVDAHPPLYYLFLSGWLTLAGASEYAARYPSALFSLLTIPLLLALGRRLIDRRAGLIAAAIAAFSPFLVYYGQEARMYTLLVVEACVTSLIVARLTDRPTWRWTLGYGAAAAALLYTHYYGAFLLAAHGILALSSVRRGQSAAATPRGSSQVIRGLLLAALLFVPWAAASAENVTRFATEAGAAIPPLDVLTRGLTVMATALQVDVLNTDPDLRRDVSVGWLMVVGAAALGLAALGGALRLLRPAASAQGLHLFLSALVPFALLALVAASGRGVTGRYLAPAFPAVALLAAAWLGSLRPRLAVPALALLLGVGGVALWRLQVDQRYWRDDIRGTVAHARTWEEPGQALLLDASYLRPAIEYYAGERWPLIGVPPGYPPDPGATVDLLEAAAAEYPYLWLVLWQDYYADPDRVVERWLEERSAPLDELRFTGGIRLRLHRVGSPLLSALPPNARPIGRTLGGVVELAAGGLRPGPRLRAGERVGLRLYWRAIAPIDKRLKVFVHLVDGSGRRLAQRDVEPASGVYPTTAWRPGDIVLDEHRLIVPAFAPPGPATLQIGMYDPATGQRLIGTAADRVDVPLEIAPGADHLPGPARRLDARFGGQLTLRAVERPEAVKRADGIDLALYWRAEAPPGADLDAFVHLLSSDGRIVVQTDGPPGGAALPTGKWPPGATIRDARRLELPPELPAGRYSLVAGLYDRSTGVRRPLAGWLGVGGGDTAALGAVDIAD